MARNSETVAAAIEAVNTIISEQNAALKALKDTLSQKAAGGGSVNPTATAKAVNFRDYDGTVLYSYTVDEAAAMTELPPLPEHNGLICQG